MDSHVASPADTPMTSRTKRPARSSARPYPKVYRVFGARRPRTNAMPSGMAVSASAPLWIVSASSPTEPERSTTASWRAAVRPSATKEISSARMPRSPASIISRAASPWS